MSFTWSESVRAVIAAALPTYTNTAGVLTASSNGALAAQDGVTLSAGDQILVAIGTSADNGIYNVTQPGTASTPWILTPHPSFSAGEAPLVVQIDGTGTFHGGSQWRLLTGGPIVPGTTALLYAPALVPRARAVATSNVNLVTNGLSAIDGVTPVAGERILCVGQSTASQNGIYLASAGTWLFAPDWVQGQVRAGQVIEISEGTSWANSSWKATAAQASAGGAYTVGTTNPAFYPRTVKGTQALSSASPSTATVSNLWIMTGAGVALVDTTAASAIKGVLSAGAGSGSLALTGPNTVTDTVSYTISNW